MLKKGQIKVHTVDDIDAIGNEIQRNIQIVRNKTNFLIGTKELSRCYRFKVNNILVTVELRLQ